MGGDQRPVVMVEEVHMHFWVVGVGESLGRRGGTGGMRRGRFMAGG